MKNLILLFSVICAFKLFAAPLYSNIQTVEIHSKVPSNMTCLSQKWFEMDEFKSLKADLVDITKLNPSAFYKHLDKSDSYTCFLATKLLEEEKVLLERILTKIDKKTNGSSISLISNNQSSEAIESSNEQQVDLSDNSFMRNSDRSMARRFARAELLVGGAEIFGMLTLLALPQSVTKWEGDIYSEALSNLERAWTSPPVWDKDDWAFNYIGHPLAGAMYYNALRSQNASMLASFTFSTLQSFIWEYGIEALAEQPSTQDLLFTSTLGSVLGELSHRATLRMRRNGFTGLERVVVTLINPTYVLNNGFR